MGACPLLEHILLDDLHYWNFIRSEHTSIDKPSLPRLRTLELGDCDKPTIITWLLARQEALGLIKFRATFLDIGRDPIDEVVEHQAHPPTCPQVLVHDDPDPEREDCKIWNDPHQAVASRDCRLADADPIVSTHHGQLRQVAI